MSNQESPDRDNVEEPKVDTDEVSPERDLLSEEDITEAEKNQDNVRSALEAIAKRGDEVVKQLDQCQAGLDILTQQYEDQIKGMKGSNKRKHGLVLLLIKHVLRLIDLASENNMLTANILNNRLFAVEDLSRLQSSTCEDLVPGYKEKLIEKANVILAERKRQNEEKAAEVVEEGAKDGFVKAVKAAKKTPGEDTDNKPKLIQLP
jgi:hypothetical protein